MGLAIKTEKRSDTQQVRTKGQNRVPFVRSIRLMVPLTSLPTTFASFVKYHKNAWTA